MRIFFFSILILGSLNGAGQYRVGMGLDYYRPQQRFGKNVQNSPIGISFNGLYQFPKSKFSLGADMGVAMYANQTYDYDLREEGAPGETVRVDEEDCFLHVNAIARYNIYEDRLVQTYAELRSGVYTFFSSRVAEGDHRLYDDQTEFHGTSFNTGLGGGVSLNLTHLFGGTSTNPIFLDFNSTYNSGTRATYRNMGNEDQAVGLDSGKYRSLVNHISFKLGFSIQL